MLPHRAFVLLLLLSWTICGVCTSDSRSSVLLAQRLPSSKPTPTPTPPPGGPNPSNPGGPSRAKRVGATGEPVGGSTGMRTVGKSSISRKRARMMQVLGDEGSDGDSESRRPCDPSDHEPENLTGTYSGKVDFPDRKLSGKATLSVEGQRFKLVTENLILSGSMAAVTTCDYTAVVLRFETPDSTNTSTNAAESISLRARKTDSDLSLTSVEGQPKFEFMPVSKARSRRVRRE